MNRLIRRWIGYAVAAVTLFCMNNAVAALWTGATGAFTNEVNWDAGVVPTNGVDASINNGGTAQIDGGGVTTAVFTLGDDAGTSGALQMTDGALTNSYFYTGKYGTGSITQSGGDIRVTASAADPSFGLGVLSGGVGSYLLSGGSLTVSGGSANFQIGGRGVGTFIQSGGAVTANAWMVIGRYGPAGNGSLTVAGGDFCQNSSSHGLIVAEGGVGSLTVTNTGTLSLNGGLRIGMVKNNPGPRMSVLVQERSGSARVALSRLRLFILRAAAVHSISTEERFQSAVIHSSSIHFSRGCLQPRCSVAVL